MSEENLAAPPEPRPGVPVAPVLDLDRLSLSFGGLRALAELDLAVADREIVSLIGPNGAGKTSVFNVITGIYQPSSGDVRFAGQSIAGQVPHSIARRGIARTFQSLRLFLNMSVIENVMAATYGHTKAMPWESVLRLPRARRRGPVLLAHVGASTRRAPSSPCGRAFIITISIAPIMSCRVMAGLALSLVSQTSAAR